MKPEMEITPDLQTFKKTGVISASEMRAVDRNADEYGISAQERMEAAGAQLANAIRLELPQSVLFLCGPGNNGGDGYVAARHIAEETSVYVLSFGAATPEARKALDALKATSVFIQTVERLDDIPEVFDTELIVDALFGTGARYPLPPLYATAVDRLNAAQGMVLACDVPSPGARADRIVAFHAAKVENSEVVSIGIPLAADICCGPGNLLALKRNDAAAHKGAGGKVLVVGGGPYQGAPFLAAEGALRGGADLVRVAAPVDGFAPDVILERLPGDRITEAHVRRLLILAAESDVVVVGPGLGTDMASQDVIRRVVAAAEYAVVDADALYTPLPRARAGTIYTPHAGEFARVFGIGPDPSFSLADRGRLVSRAAEHCGGVVLLKGHIDIISDGKTVKFNPYGDPAMTVGGTGDVLAGLCAGLLCRLRSPMAAACAAAYAAGKGGEVVANVVGDGMTATDLLQGIASVVWKR